MLGVMAIHESFHPFLIDYCVQLQMHTGAQEHSLGHDIVENNQNMCTPMAASYEDDPDYDFEQSGECGQDYNTDGVTETLSDCTIKAMQDSRDHAYHNGVH
ncbi:hypothetical protein C457_19768 [Haloferax prahovense DSM 18310]|uniref:Uncharacterized protein n=2 Tax=Haloferax prahovense TaxID=381852 RepID=M0FW71_HALPT|nr:hypothetical protein C457_19768 [Haloferax prahovense DSM 18310]